MRNIAIVEDEDKAADLLKSYVDEYAKKNNQEFQVHRYTNEVNPKCWTFYYAAPWDCQAFLDTKLSGFYEFSFSNSDGETYPRDECIRFVL